MEILLFRKKYFTSLYFIEIPNYSQQVIGTFLFHTLVNIVTNYNYCKFEKLYIGNCYYNDNFRHNIEYYVNK